MKVITEERLIKVLNGNATYKMSKPYINAQRKLLKAMIDECQELDTLTVDRLRPMSDIPIGEPVLMKTDLLDSLYATVISEDDYLDGCEGWIPMPKYEPKKV